MGCIHGGHVCSAMYASRTKEGTRGVPLVPICDAFSSRARITILLGAHSWIPLTRGGLVQDPVLTPLGRTREACRSDPTYRSTSLTRKHSPLGPCRRPMPSVLGGPRGWALSYGRGTPVLGCLSRSEATGNRGLRHPWCAWSR